MLVNAIQQEQQRGNERQARPVIRAPRAALATCGQQQREWASATAVAIIVVIVDAFVDGAQRDTCQPARRCPINPARGAEDEDRAASVAAATDCERHEEHTVGVPRNANVQIRRPDREDSGGDSTADDASL